MDLVTGAEVTVTRVVPVSRERMWDLITAGGRIGEWSPETRGATGFRLAPGARFTGHNRYPDGFETTVTCEITDVVAQRAYAWSVLDDDGVAGSMWRYELADGDDPGTCVVRHTFRHGPGVTGARVGADSLDSRLVTLCTTMLATIAAMAATRATS